MATVYLVGELGPAHRDLPPLLAMGHMLDKRGHRVVLAVRDVMGATFALRNQTGFTILQVPVWRAGRESRPTEPLSGYGDFLGSVGLDDPDEIARVTGAWHRIMENLAPDLIVAHNSPGICLAAAGRVPVIAVGDGFTVPPAGVEAFPELIAGRQPQYDQDDLLGNVNAVLAQNRAPRLRTLPSLFFTAGRFPCVLPGLDPYRGWRSRPARGPLDALPVPVAAPDAPSAYVSLATEFYEADAVLTALVQRGLPASAFLRAISADFLVGVTWPGVRVLSRGPDPARAVAEASVVVHDGLVGLTTLCVAIGRPQLIVPTSPESAVTAARAAELGVAVVAQGDPTPERLAVLVGDAQRLAGKAQAVAAGLDRSALGNTAKAVRAKSERLLSIPA